jgi:hypothetical protein
MASNGFGAATKMVSCPDLEKTAGTCEGAKEVYIRSWAEVKRAHERREDL